MAALFVMTYGVVAVSYPRQRAAAWFMGSYFLGFLTPVCELMIRFTDHVPIFSLFGYAVFLGGILMMSVGVQAFAGRRPSWRFALLVWIAGIALRLAIWGGARGTMPYELLFQLPFAIASFLVLLAVRRIGQKGPIRGLLMGIFGIICGHFLAKPFLAILLGSGASAKTYANSVYAVASQVSTGVLLVAAGLCLMLLVIQKALEESILDAETDPLTKLTNRRGLNRIAPRLMAEAERDGRGLYVLVLDLDYFKRINDDYGHATGDAVLVAFARLLETLATRDVLTVRMGGEEFALLVPDGESAPDAIDNRATRLGRSIRVALESFMDPGMPRLTVSGGVVRYIKGETLEGLVARADQLAYRAKRAGRDRILHDRSDVVPERNLVWPESARLVAG